MFAKSHDHLTNSLLSISAQQAGHSIATNRMYGRSEESYRQFEEDRLSTMVKLTKMWQKDLGLIEGDLSKIAIGGVIDNNCLEECYKPTPTGFAPPPLTPITQINEIEEVVQKLLQLVQSLRNETLPVQDPSVTQNMLPVSEASTSSLALNQPSPQDLVLPLEGDFSDDDEAALNFTWLKEVPENTAYVCIDTTEEGLSLFLEEIDLGNRTNFSQRERLRSDCGPPQPAFSPSSYSLGSASPAPLIWQAPNFDDVGEQGGLMNAGQLQASGAAESRGQVQTNDMGYGPRFGTEESSALRGVSVPLKRSLHADEGHDLGSAEPEYSHDPKRLRGQQPDHRNGQAHLRLADRMKTMLIRHQGHQ
ncbi:uncharacterized protein BXZ73DRAFT_78020 [Epithele typhae]|uniref:uncharacterized protein n=1 Tax=Epithele typhae TaxID=378194 RepID=UPI0020088717|nr:uncharacterized protein BXZ73DRAFT_78020 [Epithele typhae]KAH9929913.1 hypothetical protein BXZ73DRAFT_78020 [Epithele typhae]